tara:strand:+ start:6273 stop:7079 length:807 start_codon:yes stop_codon:yes gene_type:complete
MVGMNYGDKVPWEKIPAGADVYVVDFCIEPHSEMKRLAETASHLYWFDHHSTALRGMQEHGVLSMCEDWICEASEPLAACYQTWLKLFPDTPVPCIVRLLSRYDIWDHDDDVLAFQYGVKLHDTYPSNGKSWEFWKKHLDYIPYEDPALDILEEGRAIYKYLQRDWKIKARNTTFEVEIQGVRFLACNNGPNSSLSLESKFDPDLHDAYLIFYWHGGKKKWKFSMYSDKNNVDLGSIAKFYGGGGREKAAGFLTREIPEEVASIILAK